MKAAAIERDEQIISQETLLPFMLNPYSYPHRPRRVRLLQTHCSFVFLAGPFVYKIKKPVNFGFLNFSTLEKRRYFCEREVELNRRLSPGMYLGVVPISNVDGQLAFGDAGRIVEYAIRMRKLSDRYFMDKLVERGEVVPGDLDRIAIALRTFYQAQQPNEDIEAWGTIDRLKISTDENFRQTEEFIGRTLSRPAFESIRFYTNHFYDVQRLRLESRVRKKWIRDCHGDLHLEHIHITPRALHIYDCIEFNDRFRYVDVANDTAFLAMDLDYEGRPDLADYFVRKMAAALNDCGMLHLMDFYKCYRAYVRGKVESLHSVAHAAPEAERQASSERARRYFRLALQYAVAGSHPLVLVVMGRIASGKSTLANSLGHELGWEVFSSDRIRKELAGFPLFERSGEAARAQLYSSAATEKTYGYMLDRALEQIRHRRSVILDATFAQRARRAQLQERLVSQGIPLQFLEAHADDHTVKQRLTERENKPNEVSDARLEDFEMLNRFYEPVTELPHEEVIRVGTNCPLPTATTLALEALARKQADSRFTSR